MGIGGQTVSRTLEFDPGAPSLYINGTWERGAADAVDVVSPVTEQVLAPVRSASEGQVTAALAAARAAQRGWASLTAIERSAYVHGMAAVLRRHRDQLAALLVHEVGKPFGAAQGEIDWASRYADYMAEWDRRIEGEILPSDNRNEAIHILRMPIGVVGAITAWNFPIALFARKVAPALIAGNTVVLKPSEVAPLASIALMRAIDEELGLPAGVLNLVTGAGAVGAALVRSPQTDLLTMTGHRDTGKKIMAEAAANLTRVSLELGGKAPAIVLADADLDLAVRELVTARQTNSGQVCTCAERTFVEGAVYPEFVERYVAAVGALRVGDPWSDVDMGPLINSRQLAKTTSAVARARTEGARVVRGGGRPAGAAFEKGYWYEPTVVVDVKPGMDVMREEVFGPVMPIARVESLEDALAQSNDSRYGLSAYLFTNDYRRAMRLVQDLQFGEIYVNRTHGEQPQAHHIGWRESGLGGEDGKYGVLKYTQLKSVYHNFG